MLSIKPYQSKENLFSIIIFSFLLDQPFDFAQGNGNKKILQSFYLFFGFSESSISSLRILVGQISFRMLKEKNSPPRRIKQLFFLRIIQTFDARLRILRTINSRKERPFFCNVKKFKSAKTSTNITPFQNKQPLEFTFLLMFSNGYQHL